jgi:hypothetical protein
VSAKSVSELAVNKNSVGASLVKPVEAQSSSTAGFTSEAPTLQILLDRTLIDGGTFADTTLETVEIKRCRQRQVDECVFAVVILKCTRGKGIVTGKVVVCTLVVD